MHLGLIGVIEFARRIISTNWCNTSVSVKDDTRVLLDSIKVAFIIIGML